MKQHQLLVRSFLKKVIRIFKTTNAVMLSIHGDIELTFCRTNKDANVIDSLTRLLKGREIKTVKRRVRDS